MRTAFVTIGLLCCTVLAGTAVAQIYRWVDANGVTHFSEKKPTTPNTRAEEISEQVKDTGNVMTFTDVGDVEFYQPPERNKIANVRINIEAFDFPMSETLRDEIQTQVNGLYQAYVRWFDWSVKPTHPINIKIFGKYQLFEQYQIDTRGRFITNRSHYSPAHREVLMLGSNFDDATLQLLLHETSHAVMDMQVRTASKWLNEGIACLFEGVEWHRGKHYVRTKGSWSERMGLKLQEGSLANVADYLRIPDQKWGAESARVENSYYMIAWSLMRFLITTEDGMRALAQTLQAQRFRSGDIDELVNQLGAAYPGGLRQLDRQWREWIAKVAS